MTEVRRYLMHNGIVEMPTGVTFHRVDDPTEGLVAIDFLNKPVALFRFREDAEAFMELVNKGEGSRPQD